MYIRVAGMLHPLDRFTRRAFAAGLASALFGVAPAVRAAAQTTWEAIPTQAWAEPSRPDSGGRDAILLLNRGIVEDSGNNYRITLFRRIRVFTLEGRDAARVEVDYIDDHMKVENIRGRTVRADGTTIALDPADIRTTTVIKYRGVSYKRAWFILPAVDPGTIIEYEYTLTGSNGQLWALPWSFQNEYYTCTSILLWKPTKFAALRGVVPTWSLRRLPKAWCDESCVPDCDNPQEILLTVRAVRGARDEPWAPPLADSGPRVVMSYQPRGRSVEEYWSAWKHWLDRIARSFEEKYAPFEAVVDKAKANHPLPEDALAEVHRWLQSTVRSRAELSWEDLQTSRSTGSFIGKAATIADLVRSRRGSPYEINLALAWAARRLGFEAYVMLVRDRREGAFERNLVGPPPGDVITGVRPAGSRAWTFWDPASRFALRGSVPWYLRGGAALVTGSGRELFVGVPPERGADGLEEWTLDLKIDASGSVHGDVHGRFHGERARDMRERLWLTQPSRWSDLVRETLAPPATATLMVEPPVLGSAPDSALEVRGTLELPAVGSVAGDLMTLPVTSLGTGWLRGRFPDAPRSQNVFFEYPRRQTVRVSLSIPDHAAVDFLPAPASFENPVGAWSVGWRRIATGIELNRDVRLVVGEVPSSQYGDVRAYFSGLDRTDRETVQLRLP